MAIKQISVFVSNLTGGIADVVEILAKEDINIRALSIADTNDFGILRLIVDSAEKAKSILKENQYICSETEVLAAGMEDCPGGLAGILRILADAGHAIEYVYAFVTRKNENAFVVLRVADNEAAARLLEENGIYLVTGDEVYNL